MAYRCPHYSCEATTIEGLIQQVALSYLRHGYWWYVTGMISTRKDPQEVDDNILIKYDIRKDWRFIPYNKQRGNANLQYIRHDRFYIIMATKGWHHFKDRESKRIRDARTCPILIPREVRPCQDNADRRTAKQHRPNLTFDGHAVSYQRGGNLRKTAKEKVAYKEAITEWKKQTSLGRRLPKPAIGTRDQKWHSCVEIERHTFRRLRAYFLDIATNRSRDNLEYELRNTGFNPYQPVKRQLVRITKDMNNARRIAGFSDQIPYRVVLALRRYQKAPFSNSELNC